MTMHDHASIGEKLGKFVPEDRLGCRRLPSRNDPRIEEVDRTTYLHKLSKAPRYRDQDLDTLQTFGAFSYLRDSFPGL
jgi:hypothetical protein